MQSKKLEDVSEEKLDNMINALRTELSRAKSAKSAIEIKKRISMLEGEKVKREVVNIDMLQVDGPEIATSPQVVEKANDFGANMALGALLLGVVGYLGAGFAGKNQWTYGIGGAIVGAAGAYFLLKINAMEDKKESQATSTTQPAKS
jgi:hypothetical protein